MLVQDWLADGGGWEEGGDNVKYSFFSMTKAVEALHNRGIVHRYTKIACMINMLPRAALTLWPMHPAQVSFHPAQEPLQLELS